VEAVRSGAGLGRHLAALGCALWLASCARDRILVIAPTQTVDTIISQSKGIERADFSEDLWEFRNAEVVLSAFGSPPIHFKRANARGVIVLGHAHDVVIELRTQDASPQGLAVIWGEMIELLVGGGFEAKLPLPASPTDVQECLRTFARDQRGYPLYFRGDQRLVARLVGGVYDDEWGHEAMLSVTIFGPMFGHDGWTGEAPPLRWPPDAPR
jgi:hypothetical protein